MAAFLHYQENLSMQCIPPETPLLDRKIGVCRVYLFFLFSIQNIDYWYTLEPPRRGGSNVYPQSMF